MYRARCQWRLCDDDGRWHWRHTFTKHVLFCSTLKEELPSNEQLYNTLNDSSVSHDYYTHAQNVWSDFNSQSRDNYVKL